MYSNRRTSERHDVLVPAKIILKHKEVLCIVDNLSTGGAFIGINSAPEKDSEFDLVLELDYQNDVNIKAKVAWKGYRIQHVKTKYLGSIDHEIPGIGINFISTSPEAIEDINNYLTKSDELFN